VGVDDNSLGSPSGDQRGRDSTAAPGDAGFVEQSLRTRLFEEQARRSLRSGVASRLGGIGGRERALIELVARGRSDREIAAELDLSEESVRGGLARLVRRVGARSRAQLIAAAYEARLLPPRP
jgi:DNA-binding NarL/FixJ family response regulator